MNIALNGGEPVRNEFLPFYKPVISDKEIEEVIHTLKSGWITTGPKTMEFQKKFAEYIGIKNAIAVNSCTAGLHLALEAIGVKPGDEIITTPYTFAATANVVEQMGAKVVFVDVEEDTLNIDVSKIEEKINGNTKAIIPVHFAGHPCDMDKIMEIAKNRSLYVIEDAAHATESEYRERKIGTIGHITVFSFYATKNLCTSEGGMITTMDDELAERMRIMSLHGISKDAWNRYGKEGSWYYEVMDCGFKYNFTDIQASLGLHQLNKLEKNNLKRKEIVNKYNDFFGRIEECKIPVEKENIKHGYHIYTLRIDFSELECDRAEFMDAIAAENVGASVHFIPLHIMPYYEKKYGFTHQDFPIAYSEYMKEVSLPLFPNLTEEEINDVCMAVEKIKALSIKKLPKKSYGNRS
jgi:dTDP-4-amino-4,6-dideoxygalactose transaminase